MQMKGHMRKQDITVTIAHLVFYGTLIYGSLLLIQAK